MVKDYGFDMSDVREVFVLKDGSEIKLVINRIYREPDNDYEDENDLNYDIQYVAMFNSNHLLTFPLGKGEDQCKGAIRALYGDQIDPQETIAARHAHRDAERAARYGW